MKNLLMLLVFLVTVFISEETAAIELVSINKTGMDRKIAATKLLSAKRLGMMTFMCRFSTNKQQYVTWLMNGVLDVGKYPQFQVTSKFKKNKGVLISTMKIITPEMTVIKNNFTCLSDGEAYKFEEVEGNYAVGSYYGGLSGVFTFRRRFNNYNLSVATVKQICENWNSSFVTYPFGRAVKDDSSCWDVNCDCKDIKLLSFESARTEDSKIMPVPFFALKFRDRVNLPGNYNFTLRIRKVPYDHGKIHVSDVSDDVEGDLYVRGINTSEVIVASKEFEPETNYKVRVFWNRPLYNFHAPLRIERDITSSSIRPGRPAVVSATLKGDRCRVKIMLPANVDAKDTYDHFVPRIFLNTVKAKNVRRKSDDTFELKVDAKVDNLISVRILSPIKKYKSRMSESLKCI